MKKIASLLPSIYKFRSWQLAFSNYEHGASLRTLYHECGNIGPNVLIIKDSANHIFGGYASESWRLQPLYYGNCDCFLFTFHDTKSTLTTYPATMTNEFYMLSDSSIISMGAGGNPGLSVTEELTRGVSCPCETYDSEILGSEEFFRILNLEVWALV
jgi:hypothetical protein